MDTMMWVVLIGALVLAIGMAVFAWRLLRGDRERTEARAAMLRQLAFEPEPVLNDRVFQAPTFAPIEPAFGANVDRTPPLHAASWPSRSSSSSWPSVQHRCTACTNQRSLMNPARAGLPLIQEALSHRLAPARR